MDRLPDIRMATQNSRVKNHAVTIMGLKNTNITKLSRERVDINTNPKIVNRYKKRRKERTERRLLPECEGY